MSGLSVLTLVRNRAGHLDQLVEGLQRSGHAPDELIIVDMSDEPLTIAPAPFPVIVERLAGDSLPLAAARNRAAARASHDNLIFLDVDCIPMASCLGLLQNALNDQDGLFCADIRYLGPHDARGEWSEDALLAAGQCHPVRDFPDHGIRREHNAGLFWSLAFAIRRSAFIDLGGFDEMFVGYGAEDTDFGFRAAASHLPLYFVGGAIACHQYHVAHDPPVQHLPDIVRNARLFHGRWQRWPMEGWLNAFRDMALIEWTSNTIRQIRDPSAVELAQTHTSWPAPKVDSIG